MVRSNLPVYIQPSRSVLELLGPNIGHVALLAVRSILKNRRSLEVAFQQIEYRQHHLALSSRITSRGDLVVEIDIGDPSLSHHLIVEDEYRLAERQARLENAKVREARRRLKHRGRHW